MSSVYRHSRSDLALVPVLLAMESNLQGLRDAADLALVLDHGSDGTEAGDRSGQSRAERVVRAVTRDVNLQGLTVSPSPGLDGLTLEHGEYRVSLMLGRRVTEFLRHDAPASAPAV